MSLPFRVLRFRTSGSNGESMPETQILLDVFLDEGPTPVGYIQQLAATAGAPIRWSYVLESGLTTGLQSSLSRRELETQISDYYFQDLVSDRRHSA